MRPTARCPIWEASSQQAALSGKQEAQTCLFLEFPGSKGPARCLGQPDPSFMTPQPLELQPGPSAAVSGASGPSWGSASALRAHRPGPLCHLPPPQRCCRPTLLGL